jgi:isocitrate dehydrogenase (NAD+)
MERRQRVTLITGERIAAEVTAAAVRAVEATAVDIVWEKVSFDAESVAASDCGVPPAVIEAIERNRVALNAPAAVAGTNVGQNISMGLRCQPGLFLHFRPIRSIPGLDSTPKTKSVDLGIFQDNFQRLYSGIEQLTALGIS